MPADGGLYVITGEAFSRGRPTVEVVRQSLEGGARLIQLREKGWSARRLMEVGRELRNLTRAAKALLIINDRLDLALALDADGVHIGQQDIPLSEVRRLAGSNLIVGVSAGNPEEALAAKTGGASYLGVGPMFPTETKQDTRSVRSLQQLAEIKKTAGDLPVFAIGGIKLENTGRIIQAGADGVAVITGVVGAEDVVGTARAFVREIELNRHF